MQPWRLRFVVLGLLLWTVSWSKPLCGVEACAPPPDPEKAPDTVREQLRDAVVRLAPIGRPDFDGTSNAALATLAEWLHGAQIVGIGEGQHGMREIQALSYAIFASLVRRGFTVFALEIDQAHAARLDAFVQGERSDLGVVLEERWWNAGYYQQELPALLESMREYNLTAARRIHIAGFDFKQPQLASSAVVDSLEKVDPAAAAAVAALYRRVTSSKGFGVVPNFRGFTGALPLDLAVRDAATPLRVRVRATTSGFTLGRLGLAVEVDGTTKAVRELSAPDAATTAEIDLGTEVAASAKTVRVLLYHRGNGTVWFDRLSADSGGAVLDLTPRLSSIEPQPLLFPEVQVMDHTAKTEAGPDGIRLRIQRAAILEDVVAAARAAYTIVKQSLDDHPGIDSAMKGWTLQLARLVVQAAEWRALVQDNRDVYLAENVSWLEASAFGKSRIVLLADATHVEPIDRRMGRFLAGRYGREYRTASIYPLSGEYWYPGEPRSLEPGSMSGAGWCLTRVQPIARRIAALAAGDLVFHAAAARRLESAWSWLSEEALLGTEVDAVVVLRHASPMRGLAR